MLELGMADITDAIRQFDAAEANLRRLEELWAEMRSLIPDGMVVDVGSPNAQKYANQCRNFRHILKYVPKIDGLEVKDELLDFDAIFMWRLDAKECGEIGGEIVVERSIFKQGDNLEEYRFNFNTRRRTLVRDSLGKAIESVDEIIAILSKENFEPASRVVDGPAWESLRQKIAEINVLRGIAIPAPERWNDLRRHLGFGMAGDLYDIIHHDWPAARASLQVGMYGPDDPLPVLANDLADLLKTVPSGSVVTQLKWASLDDESFERLIFNIVSSAPRYSNAQWLTKTKAPDRGRDISVTRTAEDPLSGSRSYRVIIQCKRWIQRSVSVADASELLAQMSLWEPPKIDEIIIATTGRFTTDAVAWIEHHNTGQFSPVIVMWPESHLESLLASRPHLVAAFHLR